MRRSRSGIILVGLVFLMSCNSRDYSPDKFVSDQEQDSLIYSVIRYTAKLPPTATHATKFDAQFDPYYRSVAADYDIRAYHIGEDSTHFILMTRPARSITPMREAIGVRLTFGSGETISGYEEVFRTWKMPEAQMNERFPLLFDKMVKGESLEPYYPKNAGDQYIEFPDGRFYFDKEQRKWRDRVLDSLNAN